MGLPRAISQVASNGAVEQLDINPLLVYEKGEGAKVVDCLVVAKHQ